VTHDAQTAWKSTKGGFARHAPPHDILGDSWFSIGQVKRDFREIYGKNFAKI
jgi:hypothetical protein